MRIGYFADGPWSHRALERILKSDGMEIAFIAARYGSTDTVLPEHASKLSVPFLIHPNVNSEEFIDLIQSYGPDINVSMSFDQILKTPIIQSAPLGFINCHAGALPFYRGRNILNWALINDESKFGVTVHYVDEGIDTGNIILQNFADIAPEDNYGTVLDKAIDLCADTLYQALELLRDGKADSIEQTTIDPIGFYCGRRTIGDEWINWDWPSLRIHNFIRSITLPGPAARTLCGDQEVAVLSSELIPGAPNYIGTPGEVVGRSDKGIVVKTGDNTIRLTSVAVTNQSGSLEDAQVPRFRIGTRFGISYLQRIRELEQRIAALEQNRRE